MRSAVNPFIVRLVTRRFLFTLHQDYSHGRQICDFTVFFSESHPVQAGGPNQSQGLKQSNGFENGYIYIFQKDLKHVYFDFT